jgi:hypothetical protein
MRLSVWMCCLGLVGMPAAGFADVYAYEQDNGTRAFTDKLERVPAKYKAKAERRPEPKLAEYPRTTLVAVPPRVREGSERTGTVARAFRGYADESTSAYAEPKRTLLVEPVRGLSIPVEVEGDEPVRVERTFRWIGGRYTPVRIVRQGARVLAEISEDSGGRY